MGSQELTQEDIEELQEESKGRLTQADIESLFKRSKALDRAGKGYISSEEFLGIPELSINPLSQRLVALFENTNFQDFVRKVSLFSDKAPFEEKLRSCSRCGMWMATGASLLRISSTCCGSARA